MQQVRLTAVHPLLMRFNELLKHETQWMSGSSLQGVSTFLIHCFKLSLMQRTKGLVQTSASMETPCRPASVHYEHEKWTSVSRFAQHPSLAVYGQEEFKQPIPRCSVCRDRPFVFSPSSYDIKRFEKELVYWSPTEVCVHSYNCQYCLYSIKKHLLQRFQFVSTHLQSNF